jgi:hypothetical protein
VLFNLEQLRHRKRYRIYPFQQNISDVYTSSDLDRRTVGALRARRG